MGFTATRRAVRKLLEEKTTGLGRGGAGRVDRDQGIIRGVKILGARSPNRHGTDATNGTEYLPEAMRNAAPLYNGRPVNLDHPPKDRPGKDRSAYDRLGKIANVQVRADGIYGDLHCLKTHPMWERLAEAAEKMPEAFALSHNAWGRGEVKNGTYYVSDIPEVRSVDVVADGGTNRGLYESLAGGSRRRTPPAPRREPAKPVLTLRAVGEAISGVRLPRPVSAGLRELSESLAGRRRAYYPGLSLADVGRSLLNNQITI